MDDQSAVDKGASRDQWIELIKLYYEEWKFRQEELWKKTTQLLIIIFFTSTLPVTIKFLGPNYDISGIPILVFPIAGILLTVFFCWYFLSNASRINALDVKRKKVIEKCFGEGLGKDDIQPFLPKNVANNKRPLSIIKWRMSIWVPIFLSCIELLISIAMIILIFQGAISS